MSADAKFLGGQAGQAALGLFRTDSVGRLITRTSGVQIACTTTPFVRTVSYQCADELQVTGGSPAIRHKSKDCPRKS